MKIKIDHNEWGNLFDDPAMPFDEEVGLSYVKNSGRTIFDVIDKKLFFLGVVKYGITFKTIDVKKDVELLT